MTKNMVGETPQMYLISFAYLTAILFNAKVGHIDHPSSSFFTKTTIYET